MEPLGAYYAGILDYGCRQPDFEGVAEAVNLLRASNMKVMVGRTALDEEGRFRLPFLLKEPEKPFLLPNEGKTKSGIASVKRVFSGCDVVFREVTPSAENASQLHLLAEVAAMDPECEVARAADFAPCDASGQAQARNPFDGLVGLESQRKTLFEIGNAVAKRGREAIESIHMLFAGPPGTGKTELARRLLAFYDAHGVTSGRGVFVKADAADLIGRYVGQTPRLVRAMVRKSYGGILFIDEAYRLTGTHGNEFGHEAVNTLNEMLEADRDRFICIAAGYPVQMEELLSMNPGLRDRFGFRIAFEDYTSEELQGIFRRFALRKGFQLASSIDAALPRAIGRLRGQVDFANARSVRRLFDRVVIKQALRADHLVIEECDLEAAFADSDMVARMATRTGFS